MKKVTLSIVLRKLSSLKDENDRYPVILKVTYDRVPRYKRLGIRCKESQLYKDEDGKSRFKEIHGRQNKQDIVDNVIKQSNRILEDYFENEPFTFENFFELLNKKLNHKEDEIQHPKLCEFLLVVAEEFKQKGSGNSCRDYISLSKRMLKYVPNDIYMYRCDVDWFKKFEKFLFERKTKGESYMRKLKAAFGKARDKGLLEVKHYPFYDRWNNPTGYKYTHLKHLEFETENKSERIYDLSPEELVALAKYKPVSDSEEKYWKTWWLGFYISGVNLTDLAFMKWSDIKNNRWNMSRKKTKKKGLRKGKPLSKNAIKLLHELDSGGEYILEILSGVNLSDSLAVSKKIHYYSGYIRKACVRIAKRLEFDGHFTGNSVRYTAITTLLNKGIQGHTVRRLADHTKLSTTINFYSGSAEDEDAKQAVNMLEEFDIFN